jgi:hypothetical protein
MNREQCLHRIKLLTWVFIVGLVLSGATAIPVRWEVDMLWQLGGFDRVACEEELSVVGKWLMNVRVALADTDAAHPLLFYGTDWLAFGHFVIALAFVGALRDPVRNRWLFDFGLLACLLVIPYALMFGALRGIPFWWRLVDCSFGVFGSIPLWLCRKWTLELEHNRPGVCETPSADQESFSPIPFA